MDPQDGVTAARVKLLFVYGTLRSGSGIATYRELERLSEFIGPATLRGVLYEIDGYPGAVDSNEAGDQVAGEVRRMTDPDRVLAMLDDYEECSPYFPRPWEYLRTVRSVVLVDGLRVDAWVYLYNRPVSGLQRIASGIYDSRSGSASSQR